MIKKKFQNLYKILISICFMFLMITVGMTLQREYEVLPIIPYSEPWYYNVLATTSNYILNSRNMAGINEYQPNNTTLYAYPFSTFKDHQKRLHVKLINSKGKSVHQWQLNIATPQSSIESAPLTKPTIRAFKIHPDGSITVLVIQHTVTPWGGPLIKLDKNSNEIWRYNTHAHHDISIDETENIYALTHNFASPKTQKIIEYLFYAMPKNPMTILNEKILVLDKTGRKKSHFSIYQAMKNSDIDFRKELFILRSRGKAPKIYWDRLHANTIDHISHKNQSKLGLKQHADLMINLRDLNIILFINEKQQKAVGYIEGPWFYSHSPKLLDNGNIILFDNLGQWPKSRIIEYNPKRKKIVWQFSHDTSHKKALTLSSTMLSRVRALKNGHKVISSYSQHRIMDVSPSGKLTWEFYLPKKERYADSLIVGATGYLPEELPFAYPIKKNA